MHIINNIIYNKNFVIEYSTNKNKISDDKKIENKKEYKLLYNEWCGFCNKIMPIWDKLEKEYGNEYKFTKIECSKQREECSKYTIQGVPTIFKEEKGKVIDSSVGYKDYDSLVKFIQPKVKIKEPDDNTKEIKKEYKLLHNEWCGYCKKIIPLWDKLEKEYGNKYKFTKIECSKQREECSKYNIRGVPTIFKEKNEKIIDSSVGYKDYDSLVKYIES